MYELKKYRENINDMFEKMSGGKGPTNTAAEMIEKAVKDSKSGKARESAATAASQSNHVDYHSQKSSTPVNNNHLPVSNYVPFLPQLVEVSVNLSDSEDGSMHGNSATLMHSMEGTGMSEPSSPGSEPELRIDLGGSSSSRVGGKIVRDKHSPSKSRVAPPANHSLLGSLKRRAPQDISPDTQPPSILGHGAPKGSKKRKVRKPGEALSALLTSLTERNLKAAGSDVSAGMSGGAAPAQCNTADGGNGQSRDGTDIDGDESEVSLDSKFSSIYHEHSKTAIAVVDPDQKRSVRKKRKVMEQPATLPPKKAARVQKTLQAPTSDAPLEAASNTHSKQMLQLMARQIAAQLQGNSQSQVQSESLSVVKPSQSHPLTAQTTTSTTSAPVHTLAQPSNQKQTSNTHAVKKSKSGAASSSQPAPPTPSTTSNMLLRPNLATVSVSSAQESVQDAAGVRETSTAATLEDMYNPDLAEGSGLLADTIRKVDRSFRTRVNQIAGASEDMGYQYFTEKVTLCSMCLEVKFTTSTSHNSSILHICIL